MSANPMTEQTWLDCLEETFDEFYWSADGQERERVGLTPEEVLKISQLINLDSPEGWVKLSDAIEAQIKEKNT